MILPPKDFKKTLSLTFQQSQYIAKTRQKISQLLGGKDSRILLIVGPCSLHDTTAAKEYATKLRQLMDVVADNFLIVMRVYCEKPRTKTGWKGFIYDPFLNGTNSMEMGLRAARQFLLELAEMEVPVATEFLDPLVANYLMDLVTWGCIGARTVESPTHRQMASGLTMPVAFKNNTSGNVEAAVNAIVSASESHTFLSVDDNGHVILKKTEGNPDSHLVLRGGTHKPNFDPMSISHSLRLLDEANLPRRLLVDCSHDNSNRNYHKQIQVFQSLIQQIASGNSALRGILLESHLHAGNQPFCKDPSQLEYGVSITDPCLGWEATEQLILWGNDVIKNSTLFNHQSEQLQVVLT